MSLNHTSFSIRTIRKFLNAMIPAGTYGAQFISPSDSALSKLDSTLRFYVKKCLRCTKSTPNDVIYGELDLLPFKYLFPIELISYFWHLSHSNNLATRLFSVLSSKNCSIYMSIVTPIANSFNVDLSKCRSSTSTMWRSYVKSCIYSSFKSDWSNSVSTSRSLSYGYSIIKPVPH